MSRQTHAIEILLQHPLFERLLGPVYNAERETCQFHLINYGVLSGGEKAALSWAWVIWEDRQVPKHESDPDWKEWPGYLMRDPFNGFGVMDTPLQILVLRAFAYRHALAPRGNT